MQYINIPMIQKDNQCIKAKQSHITLDSFNCQKRTEDSITWAFKPNIVREAQTASGMLLDNYICGFRLHDFTIYNFNSLGYINALIEEYSTDSYHNQSTNWHFTLFKKTYGRYNKQLFCMTSKPDQIGYYEDLYNDTDNNNGFSFFLNPTVSAPTITIKLFNPTKPLTIKNDTFTVTGYTLSPSNPQ